MTIDINGMAHVILTVGRLAQSGLRGGGPRDEAAWARGVTGPSPGGIRYDRYAPIPAGRMPTRSRLKSTQFY